MIDVTTIFLALLVGVTAYLVTQYVRDEIRDRRATHQKVLDRLHRRE